MSKLIAIYGNKPRMPRSFPLDMAENAGNMIHVRAPQRMFRRDGAMEYFTDNWKALGSRDYAEFVNSYASRMIVTMANTIKLDSPRSDVYLRFKAMLEQYKVPITIFGLGTRSHTENLDEISLSPGAVELLQYLDERCAPVGVRGAFTKKVFEEKAGMKNVVVTGCPSFFSEPKAFDSLERNLKTSKPGVFTFSGTKYFRESERALFLKTVNSETFYIEPVDADIHRAHLQALKGTAIRVPDFLADNGCIRDSVSDPREATTLSNLREMLRSRYRLFHDADEWLDFNRRVVRFGFGTRFHVNMATLLSGKPALWLTHDSRTRELCDHLNLPHLDLNEAVNLEPEELLAKTDYTAMFESLEENFQNWRSYLEAHELPTTYLGKRS